MLFICLLFLGRKRDSNLSAIFTLNTKDSTDLTTFTIFQSIKPVLLRKINTDIRADINKQIKKFTAKIPKNVSPLDLGGWIIFSPF